MKRKALGKGLSALLPGADEDSASEALATAEVPVAALEPNPFQPRGVMAPERLAELVESIRASGIVQPILVRRLGDRFQIVAGERRFRAAQQLGLATVPVVVRDVPDDHLLELALIENIQREELSALEEAQAFQRLQEEFKLSQEEVARRVGRDRSTIANAVRLLRLPRPARELLAGGGLQAGHARALLALDRAEDQVALAREAARRGLSVREVERRVAQHRSLGRRAGGSRRDPNTGAAEERLRAVLGTRVQISRRGKGGFLRVAFGSEAELQRLYELILRGAKGRPS
jgi:ParB family transcriptional regulator, chromosome partitioning protein